MDSSEVVAPGALPWDLEGEHFFEAGNTNTVPKPQWNTDGGPSGGSSSDTQSQDKKKAKPGSENDDEGWLTDFLGVKEQEINAADATGLNVSTPSTEQPPQPFVERRQRVTIAPDGTKVTNERGGE